MIRQVCAHCWKFQQCAQCSPCSFRLIRSYYLCSQFVSAASSSNTQHSSVSNQSKAVASLYHVPPTLPTSNPGSRVHFTVCRPLLVFFMHQRLETMPVDDYCSNSITLQPIRFYFVVWPQTAPLLHSVKSMSICDHTTTSY